MSKPRKRVADRRLSRVRLVSAWVAACVTVAAALSLPRFTTHQIVLLGAVLIWALLDGALIAWAVRSPRVAVLIAVGLDTASVIGTAIAFVVLPIDDVFSAVMVLWGLSACGAVVTARRGL